MTKVFVEQPGYTGSVNKCWAGKEQSKTPGKLLPCAIGPYFGQIENIPLCPGLIAAWQCGEED